MSDCQPRLLRQQNGLAYLSKFAPALAAVSGWVWTTQDQRRAGPLFHLLRKVH
jgi:hypothetical protein